MQDPGLFCTAHIRAHSSPPLPHERPPPHPSPTPGQLPLPPTAAGPAGSPPVAAAFRPPRPCRRRRCTCRRPTPAVARGPPAHGPALGCGWRRRWRQPLACRPQQQASRAAPQGAWPVPHQPPLPPAAPQLRGRGPLAHGRVAVCGGGSGMGWAAAFECCCCLYRRRHAGIVRAAGLAQGRVAVREGGGGVGRGAACQRLLPPSQRPPPR